MLKQISILVFVLLLASCGGGGGGGDSSSKGSAPTGIRILHGALDASPVDLYSSSSPGQVVTTANFAEVTFFASLPTGVNDLQLTMHNKPTRIITNDQITVEKDKHYSLVYFGNQQGLGLKTNGIVDDAGEIPSGMAAIKVIHALVGAAALQAGYSNGTQSTEAPFGGATNYSYVPAGFTGVVVKRVNDGRIVANLSQTLEAGQAYTVFVTGQIDYYVTNRLLQD